MASAAECEFQLQLAMDLTFLEPSVATDLIHDVEKVRRMTIRLRQRVLDDNQPTTDGHLSTAD